MAGETAGGAGSPDTPELPVRRSGRQAKRTDKLEEFLGTVKRGRGGRRSAPAQLELGDPHSETTSEASFDGSIEPKTSDSKQSSPVRKARTRGRRRIASPKVDTPDSVSDSDSSENDEDSLSDMPEKTETETGADCSIGESVNELKRNFEKQDDPTREEALGNKRPPRSPAKAAIKKEVKPKTGPKMCMESDEEDESSSTDSDDDDDDDEGYDPNALYCICRQKHNKRLVL